MTRVAIVGGGMAGLVAAYYLRRQDPGCDVEVFEAGSRCGGLIRTERVDGYLLEHGADMFATQPDAGLRLCESLGIADRLILPQPGTRGAAIVDRGRVLRVPDGFVLMRATRMLPMLTTPLLSLRGKLRLAMEGLVRRRPADQEDESIESFVVRRMGREVLDRIVQPLVGGIYTGDVKKLSMAATMGQFMKMESESGSLCRATFARRRSGVDSTERTSAGARYEQFRSLPDGLQELLDALQESLPAESLRTGHRVTKLESSAGGWRLWGDDGEAEDRDWGEFDHVVLALPAALSARLLGDLAPDVAQRLRGIVAASSAVVALGVRESDIARPVDIAGFVVPLRERRPILAASFTSDKFAGRAPAGEKLIRVFFGGELQREWLERDDEELIRIAREQLGELIGLGGSPRLARVIRWNDAMPQYRVGHLQRVREIEAGLAAHAGLHLIGNSLHGVGIAPTVLAAERVATRILAESASVLPGRAE